MELNQTEKNLDATREENSEGKKECVWGCKSTTTSTPNEVPAEWGLSHFN